ncbi:MAG: hypothetical protein LBV69_11735 [Bacteroidales bacterium]|jgi:hypothetical protein|nr:hypothetical protein [Bacteroidales bacterium]
MIINTKEFSSRLKLGIMLFTLLIVASAVFTVILRLFPKYATYVIIGLFAFLILIYIIYFAKKFYYIYYNSDGLKIIIRYSSLIPIFEENSSIEIPRNDFVKAEIVKKFGGFRYELVVYVQTPHGIAKFKPVSLSTLSKKEQNEMLENLNSLSN